MLIHMIMHSEVASIACYCLVKSNKLSVNYFTFSMQMKYDKLDCLVDVQM